MKGRSDEGRAFGATLICTARGTVEKALFCITCTTCRARLKVRDEQAIGAILVCPKCGSMVQVTPPEGWKAEKDRSEGHGKAAAGVVAAAAGPIADGPLATSSPGDPLDTSGVPKPSGPDAPLAVGKTSQSGAFGDAPHNGVIGDTPSSGVVGEGSQAASLPDTPPRGVEASGSLAAGSLAQVGTWASPVELLWRKWLLLATAPVAGLVVVAGIWSIFFSSSRPEPSSSLLVQQPAEPPPTDEAAPTLDQPEPSSARLDPRWLPEGARLVFSFRPERLADRSNPSGLIDQFAPWGRPTISPVLESLGLKLQDIDRLTWASTDLSAWPQRSVVAIELVEGQAGRLLAEAGEVVVDLSVAGAACRRLKGAPWGHPFAVLTERTIVTGEAELLRRLPRSEEVAPESATLGRLLKVTARDADVVLLVDLPAVRAAGWRLPEALMDVWPAGKQPWHVIWEMPDGLGCTWHCSARLRSELALVCEGDTAAREVHAALDELVPAAGQSISAQLESLPERLQAGQMTAARAHQYESLLKEAEAALQAARWEVASGTVFVRVDWSQDVAALTAAAAETRPAIHADWLAAAAAVDKGNHQRLLSGLGGYLKAEGQFPPAAAGGALLPPETRLSWIAKTLPYFGYPQWHGRLEFGYPWNGPQNRNTTRQPLPEVVNPALGPSRTKAGFPVTHYVGVAGVGTNAGRLSAGSPRAGIFGYGRITRRQDIPDGAANTLAILGVTRDLGPWAAGGEATVRALTKRPYINGPDGFGSGQPDGMFAGMADGSVRFLSKDVDPLVLEQLATIGGREKVTAMALNATPDLPQPPSEKPEGKPLEPAGPGPVPDEPPRRPEQIDVEARLAEKIPEIDLRDVPLGEAVGLLAAMSTVPITFDPDAMLQREVSLRDPVSVNLSGATVGQILHALVSSRGLVTVVEDGQVLLTSPPDQREKLWQRRYTVADLTGKDPAAAAELAALVRKLVVPDSWRSNGGRGSIEPQSHALLVVQTAIVHGQILVFCEKLRSARGLPLRSRLDPSRFTLVSRRDQAERALALPVSGNFHETTPLIEILAYLGQLAETDILIDRLALSAAGVTEKAEATLNLSHRPLAAALDELLKPLGLAYRVVDSTTLQVTTRKAVAARLELEFYPVAELLTDGGTGAALVERIKGQLAGSTWSDAGGPGVLHFDQPSRCLIALQSQPVQAALERLLAQWRAAKQENRGTGG